MTKVLTERAGNWAVNFPSVMAMGGCATDPEVYGDHDRSADFSQYKTFGFGSPLGTDRHGYQTLVDETETSYQVGEFYAPETEGGLAYDDPRLGLVWPLPVAVISEKDSQWQPLDAVEAEVRRRMTLPGEAPA